MARDLQAGGGARGTEGSDVEMGGVSTDTPGGGRRQLLAGQCEAVLGYDAGGSFNSLDGLIENSQCDSAHERLRSPP